MTSKFLIQKLGQFLLLFVLQVVLLKNLLVLGWFNPQLYIVFLLLFPVKFNRSAFLFMAFLVGLIFDFFYHSLGMHALSCLVLAFARPYVLDLVEPIDGYDSQYLPSSEKYGLLWFVKYAFLLVLIFHICLFFLEKGGLSELYFTLLKIVASSLASLMMCVVFRIFLK